MASNEAEILANVVCEQIGECATLTTQHDGTPVIRYHGIRHRGTGTGPYEKLYSIRFFDKYIEVINENMLSKNYIARFLYEDPDCIQKLDECLVKIGLKKRSDNHAI